MMIATARTITFLRTRPAEAATTAVAEARVREGTTTLEMDSPGVADLRSAHQAGLLISALQADPSEATRIVDPDLALELAKARTPGWLVTVRNSGPAEVVLDALARSEATFLRTTRSTVRAAAAVCSLPAIEAVVSVFVDDVDQAETAVLEGAGDLLLRDWDADRIGELRRRLAPHQLVERTALPPGLEIDAVRQVLSQKRLPSLAPAGGRLGGRPSSLHLGARTRRARTGSSSKILGCVARFCVGRRSRRPENWREPAASVPSWSGRWPETSSGGRDGGPVRGKRGSGGGGGVDRRPTPPPDGGRPGHLCRQSEHQLHQSLLLPVRLLRLLPRDRVVSIFAGTPT